MGLTPLEGLMMGTRSGDIDAGAVTFIMDKEGSLWNFSEVYSDITSIDKFMDELYFATDRRNQIRLQDKANEMNRILNESYGLKEPVKRPRKKQRIARPRKI